MDDGTSGARVGAEQAAERGIDLVTVGETMARLSATDVGPLRHAHTMRVGVAGAESNVAIGFVRLGGTASWTGRLGDDELGELVALTLRGQGVATRAIIDPAAPTGLMLKERRTAASTRVLYYRANSAGARLSPEDLDEDAIGAAQVVHLTGITPALSTGAREAVWACVDIARAAGTAVSLDFNYRSALWPPDVAAPVLSDLASRSDIVFATADEAKLICSGSSPAGLARRIARLGAHEVLIKLGAQGAAALIDGEPYDARPEEVHELDPVGAGDAFSAGYLVERCRGSGVSTRLATASLAGAYAVTVDGDWEGLPSRSDLDRLRDQGDVTR